MVKKMPHCEGELYNQLRSNILRHGKEYEITCLQIVGVLELLKQATLAAAFTDLKNGEHYEDADLE